MNRETSFNSSQAEWVDRILGKLTLREAISQLLCPRVKDFVSTDERDLQKMLEETPLGCVRWESKPGDSDEQIRARIKLLQDVSNIPLLMPTNLEHGAHQALRQTGSQFPSMMALGATRDPDMAYAIGRGTAREARAYGINWTFAPVCDLNLNFRNGITNTRALTDDADLAVQLLTRWIEGAQQGGLLACTAKHFPGDGIDDRDQHGCTSVNSLPKEQWWEHFGKVWKAVIDQGVMSIMPGHIALPFYQGYEVSASECLPATVDPKLLNELLRGELKFDGVIVSDASVMGGLTTRLPADEQIVRFIEAGGDVYLFAEPSKDFDRIEKAVISGRLGEERIFESAKRVLSMKARLNLHVDPFSDKLPEETIASHQKLSIDISRKSITCLKGAHRLPAALKPDSKILTIGLAEDGGGKKGVEEFKAFDEALIERGYATTHLQNPGHYQLVEKAPKYDAVFVNIRVGPKACSPVVPSRGTFFAFWRSFASEHPNVYYTSFGSPYIEYDLPFIDNLLCAYSPEAASQQAAVKAWLGEIDIEGVCPVKLPKVEIKPWAL